MKKKPAKKKSESRAGASSRKRKSPFFDSEEKFGHQEEKIRESIRKRREPLDR